MAVFLGVLVVLCFLALVGAGDMALIHALTHDPHVTTTGAVAAVAGLVLANLAALGVIFGTAFVAWEEGL